MDESANPYESPSDEKHRFEHQERVANYLLGGFVLLVTLLVGTAIGAVGMYLFIYFRNIERGGGP